MARDDRSSMFGYKGNHGTMEPRRPLGRGWSFPTSLGSRSVNGGMRYYTLGARGGKSGHNTSESSRRVVVGGTCREGPAGACLVHELRVVLPPRLGKSIKDEESALFMFERTFLSFHRNITLGNHRVEAQHTQPFVVHTNPTNSPLLPGEQHATGRR